MDVAGRSGLAGGVHPIAEDTGLIVPLGGWGLGQACQAALRLDGIRVAVNASARQLRDAGFIEGVRALEVVVEGVETRGHVEFFAGFRRLLLQGYYFARPQAEASLRQWLAERQRGTAAAMGTAGSLAPGA